MTSALPFIALSGKATVECKYEGSKALVVKLSIYILNTVYPQAFHSDYIINKLRLPYPHPQLGKVQWPQSALCFPPHL